MCVRKRERERLPLARRPEKKEEGKKKKTEMKKVEKRNEKDGSSFALLTFESKERFLSLFSFFFLAMGDFVDHELLLSVASGIGRWVDGPGGAVYERDEDCLGEEGKRKFFFDFVFFSFDFDDADALLSPPSLLSHFAPLALPLPCICCLCS